MVATVSTSFSRRVDSHRGPKKCAARLLLVAWCGLRPRRGSHRAGLRKRGCTVSVVAEDRLGVAFRQSTSGERRLENFAAHFHLPGKQDLGHERWTLHRPLDGVVSHRLVSMCYFLSGGLEWSPKRLLPC